MTRHQRLEKNITRRIATLEKSLAKYAGSPEPAAIEFADALRGTIAAFKQDLVIAQNGQAPAKSAVWLHNNPYAIDAA